MQIEPQISYKDVQPQDYVEERIHQRIAKLEEFHDNITSCRVRIEGPGAKDFHGQVYHVRIDITVPGGEVVVNREPGKNQAHKELEVAVRDAFNAAERQLADFVRKHDPNRVKRHSA